MAWKYIMFECGMYAVPVIFPDKLVHDEVAQALVRPIRSLTKERFFKPISAGFIQHVEATVHGGSETLKLQSDPRDTNVITAYEYLHGLNR